MILCNFLYTLKTTKTSCAASFTFNTFNSTDIVCESRLARGALFCKNVCQLTLSKLSIFYPVFMFNKYKIVCKINTYNR